MSPKNIAAMLMRCCPLLASLFIGLLLTSCASERNYRTLPPGAGPAVPRFIELREEPSIATFHFPRGVYSLEAEDNGGYYYRAPRQVVKHAFAGSMPYDGGIFVRKGKRQTLRGYVVWAAGRTKIGNLTRADYEFRD
ncbi:MAG: hypothetical protein ABR589_11490 [Chthoniobacterales bacterium]